MRESNFAFPAQNRACVCISSQLYDRRALDTTSPLPLFNSLHHLTYLTSTSPRIREIMTMDGGLERLVRILHDFCICPSPPENPNTMYGLGPPNSRRPKPIPTLNPTSYDKHAAYRFSLAFQCVVNIGVRGSEPIRSRVVQAGTLDVVGCILEAWLASKGFAVGPSSSATGLPRETREQRLARRQAMAEQRQREEAAQLTRALQRQIAVSEVLREDQIAANFDVLIQEDTLMADTSTDSTTGPSEIAVVVDSSSVSVPITTHDRPSYDRLGSSSSRDTEDTSAETSSNATPLRSGTPTGAVLVNTRERSGTIIARPIWDEPSAPDRRRTRRTRATTASPPDSTDNSRPDTETEDDGDVDMDQSQDTDENDNSHEDEENGTVRTMRTRTQRLPSRSTTLTQRPRRAVGIISDVPDTTPLEVNTDAHIIINNGQGGGMGDGVGVEDGIVSLEPNDDFAMGAPPGAPGAMDETAPVRNINIRGVEGGGRADATPRAITVPLPAPLPMPTRATAGNIRGGIPAARIPAAHNADNAATSASQSRHSHRDQQGQGQDSGPFKDEDVLLSLQLLAYLSKYPHVRQAFYKPRASFHPASATLVNGQQRTQGQSVAGPSTLRNGVGMASTSTAVATAPKEVQAQSHGFLRVFASATARGKEKEKAPPIVSNSPATAAPTPRMTNVFSLVERFTFRPSASESDLPKPPPKLPPEIQYWAGVIMRNACRKDDNRGGIRQCANMLCGRWESYPREFAKCRRCRKAKYCGKECQSTAWSEGHRFWCSAKDGDEEGELGADAGVAEVNGAGVGGDGNGNGGEGGGDDDGRGGNGAAPADTVRPVLGPNPRRMERERRAMERERDRDRDRAAPPPHERSPAANTRMVGPLATQDTYNASIPQNTLRANDVRTRPSPFFYGQAQPNANATPTAHAQPTPPNAHPSLHVNVHTNTNLNGHHNRVSPEPEFGYQPPPTPRAGWGNSPIRRRAETVSGATHINWSPVAAAGAGAEVARMFRRAGGGDVFLTDARVGDDDRVPDPSRGQHTLTENHMWDQLNDALWEAPQGGNDMVLG